MKKLAFILTICVLPSLALAESNNNNIYVSLFGAYSKYPEYKPKPEGGKLAPIGIDVVKDGFAAGISAGYVFNDNFRSDVEYSYRKHVFDKFVLIKDHDKFKKGDVVPLGSEFGFVHSHSLMINGYIDLANKTAFTPFIGLGAGVTRYEERNNCGNYTTHSPAIQITTGVSYKLNDSITFDVGYRYFRMKDTNITNKCLSPKIQYRTHEAMIGMRYSL